MSFRTVGRVLMFDYKVLCYIFRISNPIWYFLEINGLGYAITERPVRYNPKQTPPSCGGIIKLMRSEAGQQKANSKAKH